MIKKQDSLVVQLMKYSYLYIPTPNLLRKLLHKLLGRALNLWVAWWPQTKEQRRLAHDFVISLKRLQYKKQFNSVIRENPENPSKKRLLGFDRHGRYHNTRDFTKTCRHFMCSYFRHTFTIYSSSLLNQILN